MHEFLEFTIIGIVLGSAYAVAASGLVVTYATSGIFNIAHGAIGMFMAFVYWQLSVGWHMNTALAFVLTVFVLAPLLGAVVERGVIQWMDPRNVATTLAVTVGLTLLSSGWSTATSGRRRRASVPQFFGFSGFTFLGVKITWEEVITVGAAVAIAVGLRLFLYRTRTGIAMRGVVDNRSLIGLFGGRSTRLSTLSWSIGASLASVAGILVAPRLQLQPLILTLLVIDAYAAAVIGRLRSLPMTFLGALIVGLASSYAVGYVPTRVLVLHPRAGTAHAVGAHSDPLRRTAMLPMDRIRSGAPPAPRAAGTGHLPALAAGRRPPRGGRGPGRELHGPRQHREAGHRAGLRPRLPLAGPAHRLGRLRLHLPADLRRPGLLRHVQVRQRGFLARARWWRPSLPAGSGP